MSMHLTAFIHQKAYEHIVHTVRRHPITFIPYVVIFLLLLSVPLIIKWLMNSMFPDFLSGPIIWPLAILFGSIYYLSICLFFYSYFVTFYLDLLIVTNDRLLDIEQKNLFSRTVAEMDLYQVQDVTSKIQGFFPSLFNYGDLLIQTAGTVSNFTVHNVPDPGSLRQAVLDLAAEDKKYHAKGG